MRSRIRAQWAKTRHIAHVHNLPVWALVLAVVPVVIFWAPVWGLEWVAGKLKK